MTRLGTNTVRREVLAADGRSLIVELTAAGLLVREKGKRTRYGPLPYGWLFLKGAELMAREIRRPRRRVTRNVLSLG